MVGYPLGGIAVLVDEAEAAASGDILRHQSCNEKTLAAAARADDIRVLSEVAVSDRDSFFVRNPVSEDSHE
jgi:hypothetical protein